MVIPGPDGLYVAHYGSGAILRVDPATKAVTRSATLCSGPQGMAFHAGLLWVTCTPDDLVLALDPATLTIRHRVPVPGSPDSVVAADGRVVVLAEQGPTLVVIDPAAASVTSRAPLSDAAALDDEANLDLVVALSLIHI